MNATQTYQFYALSHKYLGHLSKEEKQRFKNKLQLLGPSDPYRVPVTLF